MVGSITIIPPQGLERLNSGLQAYRRVSGKSAVQILVQKGAQLIYGNVNPQFGATFPGLVQLFQQQSPKPGAITAAAVSRGFRVGRISDEAIKRANFWMGGYKSILAAPGSFDGRLFLGALRVGKRGRRVTGGRRGRGGFAVSGDFIGPVPSGAKRMNFRAVVTMMEINVREAGRRFLSASWLFRQWRKLAQTDPQRIEPGTFRTLQNVNPRSRISPLGDAALSGDIEGGNAELRISSLVPGVAEVGTSRGLFTLAIDAVTADIESYLARKEAEKNAELVVNGRGGAFA
jgi:hypothetical protein